MLILPQSLDICNGVNLNLPGEGLKGLNGIHWGWSVPDGILAINKYTTRNASTYNIFSPITSPDSYFGFEFFPVLNDTLNSHAMLVASVMPTGLTFAQVNQTIANDIAAVMRNLTNSGVEVWLRFAHEMNYFSSVDTYHGSASEFVQAWRIVHDAVQGIPGLHMFWSPNWASMEDIQPWWPGSESVDIVGMDVYAFPNASFARVFDEFYNEFAKQYNKPMALGETSTDQGLSVDKEAWVKELVRADLGVYPCFKSVTWFEYAANGQDYRIIMGQSQETIAETLVNFLS
ncbi:uncharacterized protein JN550_012622 [Neoarthrinium moseri]|uniref:uncharacterized protein n=1 Tax=Neoarthrinium moseri TaxID=1658444 RepID=UPI001FDD0607|nr:uncharacterized protein JN550_012622 [Neoarthrinium moseri]KAI1858489.1 hypothetical protein JN550_012622 [Neoarthrinium moseri]